MKQCDKCVDRKLGYVSWHGDADRRHKRGQRQVRCPGCNLYVWREKGKLLR